MTEFNRYRIETATAPISSDQVAESRRELSLAAKLIASQPLVPAYSQIVLAGIVRLAEFGLINVWDWLHPRCQPAQTLRWSGDASVPYHCDVVCSSRSTGPRLLSALSPKAIARFSSVRSVEASVLQ